MQRSDSKLSSKCFVDTRNFFFDLNKTLQQNTSKERVSETKIYNHDRCKSR